MKKMSDPPDDEEPPEQRLDSGFPKVMLMMLPVQLVQAFSQNVMLSIKAIFITMVLGFGEDTAVMISHIFISFEPLSHLTGAILADSILGKWKVIIIGLILMRIPDIFFILAVLPGLPKRAMFLTAVTLATFLNIHLPTLGAFLSEQFRMPEQQKLLKRYYNILYWGRNAVSVAGAFSGSRMANMSCFGGSDCYFAPFALWVCTEIFVAIMIFCLGAYFIKKPPTSSVILHFFECIGRAIINKVKYGKKQKKSRWIDHADDVYDEQFRDEVLTMVKLSYFFSLGILYWSLYDQMYSRFIYQGAKLDNRLSEKVRVYPGDTTIVNPVLVIVLLPLLEYAIYPLLNKLNILKTDLQKVSTSEYMVATAFVAAAILEWQIYVHNIHPPSSGTGHLIIFNTIDQDVKLSGSLIDEVNVKALSTHFFKELEVNGAQSFELQVSAEEFEKNFQVQLQEGQGVSYILTRDSLERVSGYEKYEVNQKKKRGPRIRCVCATQSCYNISIMTPKGRLITHLNCMPPKNSRSYKKIKEGSYKAFHSNEPVGKKFRIEEHLMYTFVLLNDPKNPGILFESNPHSLVPYYWILPQIFIMTLGEIMHAIPWRLFIYTQSPPPMRSVVFALDLLARSLGDLIVAIVAATSFLEQVYEFILYASLMYCVSILFTIMAIKYKPHESRE